MPDTATLFSGSSVPSPLPVPASNSHALSASVVIATYNRGAVLFNTIRMVMENEHPEFECIVVDQTPNPSDDYLQLLADLQETYDFEYATLPAPNLTFARNEGIRRSSGDVVIFIDDDVELAPDFIEAHLAPYDDPSVGAVAGRVIEAKGDALLGTGETGRLLPDGSAQGNFHLDQRVECDYGRGCNMSFRRSHLHAIDGCDERYIGGFYREDSDLFARVKRLGNRVIFEPATKVLHLESDGGSRTDRGKKDRKRQFSVFHNETLFYLSCVGTGVPQFLYRMLRWVYAVKVTRGYSWNDFLYLVGGVLSGMRAFYFQSAHHMSETYSAGWQIS